jgi:acetylornithine deacetylase/succinyl-diaminopimelate desuccinylase-like protein
MKICLAVLLATLSASAQTLDFAALKPEILDKFRALVQLDTTSPPGKELAAVEYLQRIFAVEGIETKLFAMDPKRPNLVARLKGNGSKRPLLILAHTDVVGVQRDKWPVDPFGAVLKDGYIWGRGAQDDKPNLAANLMTMLLLKRSHVALDRDVIFMAEAGEEADVTGVGINYMVREHFPDIEAEFSITEAGGATIDAAGKVTTVTIETAEKVPARVRLVANGTSGHGSIPRLDNAVTHLSEAVAKAGTWETPMRLNDTTRAYFERLARVSSPETAALYNGLLNPVTSAASQKYLREHEPNRYSMLRTSVVPTMLKAGVGPNVIPSEAEAILDIRALPDEDIEAFYEALKKRIGDNAVRIEPLPRMRPPSPPSRLDTDAFHVLESVAKKMYAGAAVLPLMQTGSTDMAQLRARGVESYGIGPATTLKDEVEYGAHSDVERLAEASLYAFVEYTWNVVTGIAARR